MHLEFACDGLLKDSMKRSQIGILVKPSGLARLWSSEFAISISRSDFYNISRDFPAQYPSNGLLAESTKAQAEYISFCLLLLIKLPRGLTSPPCRQRTDQHVIRWTWTAPIVVYLEYMYITWMDSQRMQLKDK